MEFTQNQNSSAIFLAENGKYHLVLHGQAVIVAQELKITNTYNLELKEAQEILEQINTIITQRE